MAETSKDLLRKQIRYQILLIASVLFFLGLIGMSIASFIQTEIAFRAMNDSEVVFFTFIIGNYMSYFAAFVFQYGQNVALFIRKEFLIKKVIFRFAGINFTQKKIALLIFWIFAVVDGGTNVLWFKGQYVPSEDEVKNILIQIVSYSAMIAVVGSEEMLEWAWSATSRIWIDLMGINKRLKKARVGENKKSSSSRNTSRKQETYQKPSNQKKSRLNQNKTSQNKPNYHNLKASASNKHSNGAVPPWRNNEPKG